MRKNRADKILLASALLSLSACGPSVSPEPTKAATGPSYLQMEAGAHSVGRLFVIAGSTNLPNGTKLIVSLNQPHGRLLGQADVVVGGGKFTSEPFSMHGRPYKPGAYALSVSASMSSLQSDSVQALVGRDYANFTGPFIDRSTGVPFVNYETAVRVR